MITDIELTLDADYVCDTYADVLAAAIDIESLLSENYGMKTNVQKILSEDPQNTLINNQDTGTATYLKGYEVKGEIIIIKN